MPSTISYRLPGTTAPGILAFDGTLMRAADVRAQISARMCCPEYTIELINATTSQPIALTDNIPAFSEVAVRRLSDPQAYAAARGGGGGAIGGRGRGFGAGMQAPPLSAAAIRAGDAAAAEAAKARHFRADAVDPAAAAAAAGGLSGAALDEAERLAAIAAREAAALASGADSGPPAPVSYGSYAPRGGAGGGRGAGGAMGGGGRGTGGVAAGPGGGGGTGGDPVTLNRPPREGYTCYICGRAGHYIEHCPEASSNGGRGGGGGPGGARHPKRFTNPDGIPESELERVERGDPTATFITRDGQWVRRKMLGASALTHLLAINQPASASSAAASSSAAGEPSAVGSSSGSGEASASAEAKEAAQKLLCVLCGTSNDLQRLPCECAALLCSDCVDSRIELGDEGPECPKCRGAIQLDEIVPVE
jgi:hypothetical protein